MVEFGAPAQSREPRAREGDSISTQQDSQEILAPGGTGGAHPESQSMPGPFGLFPNPIAFKSRFAVALYLDKHKNAIEITYGLNDMQSIACTDRVVLAHAAGASTVTRRVRTSSSLAVRHLTVILQSACATLSRKNKIMFVIMVAFRFQ